MARLTGPGKVTGQEHTAAEYTAMKNSINALYDVVEALIVGGKIPTSYLPDFPFDGNQFRLHPDGVTGFQLSPEFIADLTNGTVTPSLNALTLTASVISTTQINLSWTVPSNGSGLSISYTLQRATDLAFTTGLASLYTGSLLTFNDNGLNQNTTYYYRVVASASGYNQSGYGIANATTQTTGNTTPANPTLTPDDLANTLTASHALGISEIMVSVQDAAYVQLTAVAGWNATTQKIDVGDVARISGYWKFKVKAAAGRNESGVVNSPEFTVAGAGQTTVDLNWTSGDLTNAAGIWTKSTGNHSPYSPTLGQIGAGVAARIWFRSDNIDSNFIIGINANQNVGYQGLNAAAQLSYYGGNMRIMRYGDGETPSNSNVLLKNTTATYTGLFRDSSGEVKIQESNNGITWTDAYSFPIAFVGALYISISMDSAGKIYNPKLTTY